MENNFSLTGQEARILMVALMSCPASAPMSEALSLFQRLAVISQVQPATQPKSSSGTPPDTRTVWNEDMGRDT